MNDKEKKNFTIMAMMGLSKMSLEPNSSSPFTSKEKNLERKKKRSSNKRKQVRKFKKKFKK